jgi:hypothetical protein
MILRVQRYVILAEKQGLYWVFNNIVLPKMRLGLFVLGLPAAIFHVFNPDRRILSSAYTMAAFRPIQPIWQNFRRMYLCLIIPPVCCGLRNHQRINKCTL